MGMTTTAGPDGPDATTTGPVGPDSTTRSDDPVPTPSPNPDDPDVPTPSPSPKPRPHPSPSPSPRPSPTPSPKPLPPMHGGACRAAIGDLRPFLSIFKDGPLGVYKNLKANLLESDE